MNERIAQAITTMKQGYIYDPNRILADYRKETAEIKGYHGRELLELLQNAVDELAGTEDRSVYISLNNGILKICNKGNVFTYDGFISLMYSNLSPKHNKAEYIGNKGTGFRSILNWAKSVRIYSGALSVEFSDNYAEEMLNELMSNNIVKTFCQNHEDVHLATLVAPKIISGLASKSYDTIIQVSLREGIVDKVVGQLTQINAKTLLFLENLEHLTVEMNGDLTTYDKSSLYSGEETTIIRIETQHNDELTETEEWSVVFREGKYEKQKYGVTIAYKTDMTVRPDVLYSYFKTKVQFPVPALVHATFDLNADRNHLSETEANKHILKVVCGTLAELALLATKEGVNYAPLALLSTVGEFPADLSWEDFDIQKYYYDAIAEKRVLPTVNGEYISFNESPRFYDSAMADSLSGDSFGNLLPHTDNVVVSKMIKAIAKHRSVSLRYEYINIVNGINSVLGSVSINTRAALWLDFTKEYGNEVITHKKPLFVLDATGKNVNDDIQVFLPSEGLAFSSPPAFTRIVFLNKELVTALRELRGKDTTLRSLASELSIFNVREYNLVNIINAVISKLRSREHQGSKKTRGCYEETIEWLWKLWSANVLKSEMSAINAVPLLNRNGIAKNASEIFFGRDFGNEITEDLFAGNAEYFVAFPRRFALSDVTKPRYVEFLSSLGVADYPKKKPMQLRPVPEGYKEIIYQSIKKYPLLADDNRYQDLQEFRNAYFGYVTVTGIEQIEDILLKASTKSIIDWIRNDDALRHRLADYEQSSSRGYVYNNYQQKYRTFAGEQIASYIRYIFATSKWVEVDGQRYSPKQCIFANKIGSNFAPLLIAPDLGLYVNNQHKKIVETTAVQDILERIGAAADYSELDTETFYSLLLRLPEVDTDGDISKSLYTAVLKAGGLQHKLNTTSQAYKQFMQAGKVYCKSSKAFENLHSVFYLTEKTVSREILKDFSLIAIPSRQSQENIKLYFGVSPLRIKGSVVGEPVIHSESSSFEQDFNDFICYAFCSRVDAAKQSEISTVKALRARLCTNIEADYGKGIVSLGENSYIRDKNCIYVQAPANCLNLKQLKSNVDFCSAIAELFMTAIDIQDENLYGYVRSLYEKEPHNRNALILHDFDDLSILERAREALSRTQSTKEMFISTCVLIAGESIVAELKDEISKINFSDFSAKANAEALIIVLTSLNCDADDFNEKSEVLIDLCPYYGDKLRSLVVENEEKYKNGLFASLKGESNSKKRLFLKQYQQYKDYRFSPPNSVAFNPVDVFIEMFGAIIQTASGDEANAAWKVNKESFIKGKDLTVVNDMLVDSELESLLYFGIFDVLEANYEKRKAEISIVQQQESAILAAQTVSDTPIITIEAVSPTGSASNHGATSHSSGSRLAGMKRERNISDWGAFAERLVYDRVKATQTNVEWVSENAKKEGVNPDGIGGLGYDLKYTDSDGELKYVEIKSAAGSNISFVITENELNFAESHPAQFEIILVTSVMDDNERKIYRLPNLFMYGEGEDRLCNSKFRISGDNYTIRCQQRLAQE